MSYFGVGPYLFDLQCDLGREGGGDNYLPPLNPSLLLYLSVLSCSLLIVYFLYPTCVACMPWNNKKIQILFH